MICPFALIHELSNRVAFLTEALAESEEAYAELQAKFAEFLSADMIIATPISGGRA